MTLCNTEIDIHTKCSYSHVQNIIQTHRQTTKLRNMIISIKTKVLIKFGTSEMTCVELRAKSYELCTIVNAHNNNNIIIVVNCKIMLMYTHAEVTTTISTVYTTLDFEYRHENKGTVLALVPRRCWVYE
jgi:hypothetical protein